MFLWELCISEKLAPNSDPDFLLIKGDEIISNCRHRNASYLKCFKDRWNSLYYFMNVDIPVLFFSSS